MRSTPTHSPGSAREGGGPSDQVTTRRSNLSLILRHLRDHGGRPRSQVAAETGLSKATASTLIADLVARGLLREGEPAHDGRVGRPGLTVQLDGEDVCAIGLEIGNDYLCLVVMTLGGEVRRRSNEPLDVAAQPVDEVLDRVAGLLRRTLKVLDEEGARMVGLGVAAPGVINGSTGSVRFAPNLGWSDVPLADELRRRLGGDAPSITVENDAKLGAIAEHALVATDGVRDLLYVTGGAGVGGGVISGGTLLRGHAGFAGEIGHLPLGDPELRCKCGRLGCWEGVIGLPAFLASAADPSDPVRDSALPLPHRLEVLHRRMAEGDERSRHAASVTFGSLGRGVSVVVDVLNPKTVILGGYFAWFGDTAASTVHEVLESRRIGPMATPVDVRASSLGLESAAQGGARLALSVIFRDPTLVGVRAPG